MPGNEKMKFGIHKPYISTSLQIAPGVTKHRPQNGALPSSDKYTWYEGMDYGKAYNTTINAFFYGSYQDHGDPRHSYQVGTIVRLQWSRRRASRRVAVVGRASEGGSAVGRASARAQASGAIRLVVFPIMERNPNRERARYGERWSSWDRGSTTLHPGLRARLRATAAAAAPSARGTREDSRCLPARVWSLSLSSSAARRALGRAARAPPPTSARRDAQINSLRSSVVFGAAWSSLSPFSSLEADAVSANSMLHKTHFEEQHIYRVEWLPDANDGYVVWYKRAPRYSHRTHGTTPAALDARRAIECRADASSSSSSVPTTTARQHSILRREDARAPHQTTRVASRD